MSLIDLRHGKVMNTKIGLGLILLGLTFPVSQVTAQSLSAAPTTVEVLNLILNPGGQYPERITYPGLDPLPELALHSMFTNILTGQALLMNDHSEIDYKIPVDGHFPFVDGMPDRPMEVPLNETDFIEDRIAATQLGKALFWDMQVGSDSVQSCGTCHFHAGSDNRTRNTLNPASINGASSTLEIVGKNQDLVVDDFPFHKLIDPNKPGEPMMNPENMLSDTDDVQSSMGVRYRVFVDIWTPGPSAFIPGTVPPALRPEIGRDAPDPLGEVFEGVRRVEPRHTPTFFQSALNYDNFWDGRARHDFNGGSPQGASDPEPHIYVDGTDGLTATRQLIRFCGVASLATGPPLSNFEMSFDGRNWAKIAKKLLQDGVTPLANQLVDTTDSVLGPLSNQNWTPGMPGINISYADLIELAFGSEYWSNTTEHLDLIADPTDPTDGVRLILSPGASNPASTIEFTQKEANFSLFFGLSTQAYTQILLPNQSPFDRFHEANPEEFLGIVTDIDPDKPGVQVVGLSERQLFGYDIFQNSNLSGLNPHGRGGECNICHFGPEMTEHSISLMHGIMPPDLVTGEDKMLTGFILEEVWGENAGDAMELDAFVHEFDEVASTTAIGILDRGVYNIGVRPINEDLGRGADDLFGFPLSLTALAMQNEGIAVGEYTDSANAPAPLPDYLAPFVNPFPVGGAYPNIALPIFSPDAVSSGAAEILLLPSGTYPYPNRVGRMGNFKVPGLKNLELTGPYFHNGGTLTLRQVVDFYARGGDFPETNRAERDPLIRNLNIEADNRLDDSDKTALVDFLLALTDERAKYERAPFDHPEVIIPLDGTAPDNWMGRDAMLKDPMFRQVAAVGSMGSTEPLANFLGISSIEGDPGPDHFDK